MLFCYNLIKANIFNTVLTVTQKICISSYKTTIQNGFYILFFYGYMHAWIMKMTVDENLNASVIQNKIGNVGFHREKTIV